MTSRISAEESCHVALVGENRHNLCLIADFQGEVATLAVTGVDFQAGESGLLEVSRAGCQGIHTDGQLR